MKACRRMTGRRAWSLIELTIILVVLAILCAILAPVIGRYVRHAKIIRCREDVQAIGSAIWMFVADTGNSFFMQDGSPDRSLGAGRSDGVNTSGSAPDQSASNRVDMLVSGGDVPEIGSDGASQWSVAVNRKDVDFMEYHLVIYSPGNGYDKKYRTPLNLNKGADAYDPDPLFANRASGGFNSEFSWRGPYLTSPVDPDPWGNRYASNVKFLDARADTGNTTPASNGFAEDVVVLSAGPDEEIDSAWAADGLTPGDDDLLYTVSANSRP